MKDKIMFDVFEEFNGNPLFTAEIECDEDASEATKLGLAVKWAVANEIYLVGANLKGADLTGADIEYANLSGVDLAGADLSYANLTGVDFSCSSLRGANLRAANLWRADLKGTDIEYADFSGADLSEANLAEADLAYSILRRADLSDASLTNAILKGMTGNSKEIKSIQASKYDVVWTKDRVQIGCRCYTKDEWLAFTDDEISEMDEGALEWWHEWKPKLTTLGVFESI